MPTKTLFWISLALLLLCPSWPLCFFAPYLVASSYRFGLLPTLFRALYTGFLITLFSSSPTLVPSYLLAALFLTFHSRNFFVDKWTTLPLLTYLFSLYVSLFFYLFSKGIFFLSAPLILTEVILSPLSDTLLAGIIVLIMKRRKKVLL